MFLLPHYQPLKVRFFETPLLYGEYQTLSSQGQIELVLFFTIKALQLAVVSQIVAVYTHHQGLLFCTS